jgi:hypothetical protein
VIPGKLPAAGETQLEGSNIHLRFSRLEALEAYATIPRASVVLKGIFDLRIFELLERFNQAKFLVVIS